MMRRSLTLVVSILLTVTVAPAARKARPTPKCPCPQETFGWLLFEDCSLKVPDFWMADSVLVQEIRVCPHGVNFFFVAEEEGQPHYVALVLVNPTRELYETRVMPGHRSDMIEARLAGAKAEYANMLSMMAREFGDALFETNRLDFRDRPEQSMPSICPGRCMTMKWQGNEFPLLGYVDVYLSLIL